MGDLRSLLEERRSSEAVNLTEAWLGALRAMPCRVVTLKICPVLQGKKVSEFDCKRLVRSLCNVQPQYVGRAAGAGNPGAQSNARGVALVAMFTDDAAAESMVGTATQQRSAVLSGTAVDVDVALLPAVAADGMPPDLIDAAGVFRLGAPHLPAAEVALPTVPHPYKPPTLSWPWKLAWAQ